MSDIVTESHVFVDCKAATIDEVLAFFAEKTVELGFADDANAIFEAFKATHLRLLSKIAVMLMDAHKREELLAENDSAKLAALVNEGISEE